MGCETHPETARPPNCVKCSKAIAEIDLKAMAKYKNNITEAASEDCFPPALLAAFISRETRGGAELIGTNGWITCHNDHYHKCYGLMHLPEGNQFSRIFYLESLITLQSTDAKTLKHHTIKKVSAAFPI